MRDDLELALDAARTAAAIVVDGFASEFEAELKGEVDPVTEIDRLAEDAMRRVITASRPADMVLGEERGGAGWQHHRVWILDPLDGTVNFIHRLPQVAVSVALWEDGSARVGVVLDAVTGEVFTAEAGGGAALDGAPLRVSEIADLSAALVGTGFPYDRRQRAGELATVLGRVLAGVQGIRRIGSAALDLCFVAAGRFDGYWETGLRPWDAAAGVLVVTEAGGVVTDFDGAPHRLDAAGIVASNGLVHEGLRRLVVGTP